MTKPKPRDDPEQPFEGSGGYRINSGQKPGVPRPERIPGVRSLFGTDKEPINEDGQKWRRDNLAAVEKWAKEKNALTTALDNLLAQRGSATAQRSIVEFLVGRPVSQSEITQTVQTPDDSAKAVNSALQLIKEGLVENGVDAAFADRIVEQALWGGGVHEEVDEEDDEEVFGVAE